MAESLTLDAVHTRGADIDTFDIELRFPAGAFGTGSTLVLTSVMRLSPEPGTAELVEQVGSRTALAPVFDHGLTSRSWQIPDVRCEFRARHANDGPASAYIVCVDGTTLDVVVRPATTTSPFVHAQGVGTTEEAEPPTNSEAGAAAHLLPAPRQLMITSEPMPSTLRLVADRGPARDAWNSVVALAARLGEQPLLRDRGGNGGGDGGGAIAVATESDPGLGPEDYRLSVGSDSASVTASTAAGFRHGFVTAARWLRNRTDGLTVSDGPAHRMRVIHLDVARRWYEPAVVLRLIDLAAWRKFNVVHLHLTDDEAWRVPIAAIPELARLGGTRGHARPVGSLCGSGAAPYGRAYTADDIGTWVRRADDVGITLVPEVDVPGHCHAALAALPQLRDPQDRSHAVSIQGFVDNTLVPGHRLNDWFIDTVFSAVADLFPRSPHLHIGGDEVPHGAWMQSPLAGRFATDSAGAHTSLYSAFVRSIIDRVHAATGRRIGAWEEAATSRAMRPDDGYVVAWTSAESGAALAEAGFDVVVSPGQAYYLDMATDPEWSRPGATWAGHVPLASTIDFNPTAGWNTTTRQQMCGVQACIWSEHIDSIDVLDDLVFPRLDAIAQRGWTGFVDTSNLVERSRSEPRFGPRSESSHPAPRRT